MKPNVFEAEKLEYDISLTNQGHFVTVYFERQREEFKIHSVNNKGLRGEHSFNQ